VPFLKIAPQASALCPCCQCGSHVAQASAGERAMSVPPAVRWPRAVSQPHTFSKSAILYRFPNFYTLRVETFRMFFPFTSTYDPYKRRKVSWKSVRVFFRNLEDRHTDGQTDAAALHIPIDTLRGKNGLYAFGNNSAETKTDLDKIWNSVSQMWGAGPGRFWARSAQ